jgi:23S rRNA (uracil1939-C5)-methyltransferase
VDPKTFKVTPTTFTYGGEVLARLPDGRAVFVPYALPAERVRVQLVEEKRGYARAELLEVLEASPERIDPRCRHFAACGGCHYQHMPYQAQLKAKAEILSDQLERIGKLQDPPVLPPVPCPQPWHYRNHIQFHLTEQGQLGFQGARSQGVIPIQECHLPEETINAIWPLLEIEPVPGLERVGLRSGIDAPLLTLESRDPQPLVFSVDLPVSAVHLGPGGALVLAGDDHIFIEVLERSFRVSAGSFFQVNTTMAAALVEHLLEHLPLTAETTLVEGFCGVGLFSAFLAPRVGELIAIESHPGAAEDFVANLDEFDNVALYEAPVEDVLSALEVQPDIILVDPPRAGLGRQSLDAILDLGPALLAYVSCDPATLARDAKRLTKGGYRLNQVTPFDLFPQTYHIESVSLWEKSEERD